MSMSTVHTTNGHEQDTAGAPRKADRDAELVERLRRSRRDQLTGWLQSMDESQLLALIEGLDALAEAIELGNATL
jgi:hypothetical protein